jgi:transposase InsO family protein
VSRALLAKRPNHVWMIDFTRSGGVFSPLWVGAVIEAYSRRVLAIGAIRWAPTGAFAVLLFRRAIRSNGSPRWLVSDQDPVLRGGLSQRFLTRRGILRRYGAVWESGSIGLIECFWHSMKEEYASHLCLYRSTKALGVRLERYRRWFDRERPHQGTSSTRQTTSTSLDPRSRRETSPAAGCTSGFTLETRGSLFCAFATPRRSPPSRPSDRARAAFAHRRGPEFTRVRRVRPRSRSSEPR